MPLRQVLGEAERHREHVLRHCSRVSAGIAGHCQPFRQRREVDRVDTCRKELGETER